MDAIIKKMWTDGGGQPLSVSVESELFGAAGLGSSAAICSAVAAGLLNLREHHRMSSPFLELRLLRTLPKRMPKEVVPVRLIPVQRH